VTTKLVVLLVAATVKSATANINKAGLATCGSDIAIANAYVSPLFTSLMGTLNYPTQAI
jgi:hypothetical protein